MASADFTARASSWLVLGHREPPTCFLSSPHGYFSRYLTLAWLSLSHNKTPLSIRPNYQPHRTRKHPPLLHHHPLLSSAGFFRVFFFSFFLVVAVIVDDDDSENEDARFEDDREKACTRELEGRRVTSASRCRRGRWRVAYPNRGGKRERGNERHHP